MQQISAMAVFAAVVEARSFSGAAERLGLSKSAVSKHLSRLEDALGARLLNRTTRRISVTEVGEIYYAHCARILAEAEAAEAAVSQLRSVPSGRLRINAPMSFGLAHLSPAITSFMQAYPEITVELDLDDKFVDVIDGGYDVVIRISRMRDSSLIARRLAVARVILAASPEYIARYGNPETPADLKGHKCLHYNGGHAAPPEWTFHDSSGRVQTVPVSGPLIASFGDLIRDAGIAGLGIIRQPTFIIGEAVRSGKLLQVLPQYRLEHDPVIYAVYPHRRHLLPKVRAFVDHLADTFGDNPYWDDGIEAQPPAN